MHQNVKDDVADNCSGGVMMTGSLEMSLCSMEDQPETILLRTNTMKQHHGEQNRRHRDFCVTRVSAVVTQVFAERVDVSLMSTQTQADFAREFGNLDDEPEKFVINQQWWSSFYLRKST